MESGAVDINLLVIIGRVAERLLIVLAGMLALCLGYRLFKIVAESESSGNLEFQGAKIRLQKIGPGIFFALFGAVLMGYALTSSAQISTSTEAASRTVYMGNSGAADAPMNIISAVNTIGSIIAFAKQGQIPAPELARLEKALAILASVKNQSLDAKFGPGTASEYNLIKKMCVDASVECRDYLRNKKREDWYTKVDEAAMAEVDP